MSYFSPIEFDEPKDPGAVAPSPPKVTFNKEKIKAAIVRIEAELEKVRVGKSPLMAYAINPGRFGFAITNLMSAVLADPTEKAMAEVVQIAAQDLGINFAEFVKLTLGDTKETPNV